ncbi:MAG: hypothetical protein ACTSPE_08980 [Candidatus Thorarchaeota archaeon]
MKQSSIKIMAVAIPLVIMILILIATAEEAVVESFFGVHPYVLMALTSLAVFPLLIGAIAIWESM